MTAEGRAQIAVVIPTRDRGRTVERAVESILASDRNPTELIIVDQTPPDDRIPLSPRLSSADITYVTSETVGISAGLNIGLAQTSAELVAITGDDCEVMPSWLERVEAEFTAYPDVGILFGNILPGVADSEAGFTPSCTFSARSIASKPSHRHRVGGTSACMALRREVWEAVGGFDEMLGVGAPFGAAEDGDLAMRALQKGYAVMDTPHVEVKHYGVIPWSQRADLIERNWFGTGAALSKPLKEGRLAVLIPLLGLGGRWILGRSRVAKGLGTGPHRAATVTAFLKGFWAGLRYPVSSEDRCFRQPGAEPSAREKTRA